MSKTQLLILAVVLSSLKTGLSIQVKEENHILVLEEANFNEVAKEKEVLLVMFYVADCQPCSELETKLFAATTELLRLSQGKPSDAGASTVGIAKVDAAAETALAARHGAVGHYPALKLLMRARPGESPDYDGPLDTAEGIAGHLRAMAGGLQQPLAGGPHRLTEGNLTDAFARQATWLVAFLDLAADLETLDGLRAGLEELRGGVAVGYADARGAEAAMAERFGVKTGQLPVFAVLKQGQDWAVPFSHPPSGANLAKFYRTHEGSLASGLLRTFAALDELDSVNEGLDALLLASSAAQPGVRRFLAAFLAESGFFYERRLEGGLASAYTGLAARLGVTSPDSIYVRLAPRLLVEGEPALVRYTGPLDNTPALKAFFDRRSLPRLGLLAWNTRRAYMSDGRPLCVFYASLSGGWRGESGRAARERHARLARMTAGREGVLFALADETQESVEAARFGFDESSSDVNLGCYDSARRRFPMLESDGPDPSEVRRFLDAFEAGSAPQRIRSAPVPLPTGGRRHLVAEVNADRLDRMLAAEADGGSAVLLIQCDFAKQPCAHSLSEFEAAAAAAAAPTANAQLHGVRFARLNTGYNDAPAELYYRYEGEAAVDLVTAQPQVLLLPLPHTAHRPPIRYERDAVAKDYLLQFLAGRLAPSSAAAPAGRGGQEL